MKIGPSTIGPGAMPEVRAPGGVQLFRQVLSRKVEALTLGWRQMVRAEPRYSAAPVLEPPPRPVGAEVGTAESRRAEFRGLVGAGTAPVEGGEARAALCRMVEQRLESEELMLARASQGRR